MLRHSPIESPIEVAMAKGQMRSNKEKKKPKQDKNKKKPGEAPSPSAIKLGTSYMSQYGKKH
jgi:hypothetical protein